MIHDSRKCLQIFCKALDQPVGQKSKHKFSIDLGAKGEGMSLMSDCDTTAKIVIDLDGTLTLPDSSKTYPEKLPNLAVVEKLRQYRDKGFAIAVYTARNMRSFEGNVGLINVNTLPVILDWLRHHDVPFDEVIVGKPWCGNGGFYVDDRAIRPDEFVNMSPEDVSRLMGDEAYQ